MGKSRILDLSRNAASGSSQLKVELPKVLQPEVTRAAVTSIYFEIKTTIWSEEIPQSSH